MNKTTTLFTRSAICLSTIISTSVIAVEGLFATVGVTNNYLWRGLEQTNGASAISGGINYKNKSGFYVGTWGSSADWAPGMTYEIDVYGGYTGQFDSFSYDVGFIHYAYPDSTDDENFTEINAKISSGAITLGYAVLANADNTNFGDDAYIFVDAEFELASEIALTLHVGSGIEDFYAREKFIDYGASLSKNSFIFGVSKTD